MKLPAQPAHDLPEREEAGPPEQEGNRHGRSPGRVEDVGRSRCDEVTRHGDDRHSDGNDCGTHQASAARNLTLRIPVRAATSQNARFLNPFARAAIVKRERRVTKQAFEAERWKLGDLGALDARYAVKLVRIGPNELDEDNLQGALKAVRDELAELLGLPSDRDRRIRWVYAQRSEGYLSFRDPKTGRRRRTGIFAVEVLIRRQTCADCWVEHCECLHLDAPCADCEAAG